jgi:hypothetical protein
MLPSLRDQVIPLHVFVMETVGHFDGINPRSTAGETVVSSVDSLLPKH